MIVQIFKSLDRYYCFNVYNADEQVPQSELPSIVLYVDNTFNFTDPFALRAVRKVDNIEDLAGTTDFVFVYQHKLPVNNDLHLILDAIETKFENEFSITVLKEFDKELQKE